MKRFLPLAIGILLMGCISMKPQTYITTKGNVLVTNEVNLASSGVTQSNDDMTSTTMTMHGSETHPTASIFESIVSFFANWLKGQE